MSTDPDIDELISRTRRLLHERGKTEKGAFTVTELTLDNRWRFRLVERALWIEPHDGNLYTNHILFVGENGLVDMRKHQACIELLDYLRREMVLDDIANV